MTFDTAFERSHPPNTPETNDDDKAIHNLLLEWGTIGDVDSFRQSVVRYITTVREEVRQAAFREATNAANRVQNNSELDDGGFFEAGFIAARTKIVDTLIEAAANDEEGGGDAKL